MIIIKGTSLEKCDGDYFLFCQYTPSVSKGDCTKEGCKFNTDSYYNFFKRVKEWKIYNGIIYNPIPIYDAEFIGKRQIFFRYGIITITDDLRTDMDKDFGYLKDKRLYLKVYRDNSGSVRVGLMIKGNQRSKKCPNS